MLLALAVVLGHLGYPLIKTAGGVAAVQAFFIISGFYIAMALGSSYKDSNGRFWLNRALRLYPVYLFVAAAALAFRWLTDPSFIQGIQSLPSAAQLSLWLSNAALVGQDWVMFAGIVSGHLAPVSDFRSSEPQLWTFLLIPPAWSLGVELTFYVVAPFLLRLRTRNLVMLVMASWILRVALAMNGLHRDPWSYRFFPNEIAMFLIGSIAFRLTGHFHDALPRVFARGREATVLVVVIIILSGYLPGPDILKRALLLVSMAATLPMIFEYSKRNALDRAIGDLSYPLYISHWTTLAVMAYFLGKPGTAVEAMGTALACVLVAVALGVAIDQPVQRVRARFRDERRTRELIPDCPYPVTQG